MAKFMFATGIENSYPVIDWQGKVIRQNRSRHDADGLIAQRAKGMIGELPVGIGFTWTRSCVRTTSASVSGAFAT